MTTRLCEIVAVVRGLTARTMAAVNDRDNLLSKPQLFNGMQRVYSPLRDDGENLPPERVIVQRTVAEELRKICDQLGALIDVTATRDYANTNARADITVAGVAIVEAIPVTHLMFLEKMLQDMRVRIGRLPVRDPSEVWLPDENPNLARTQPTQAFRDEKTLAALTKYEATKEHPAQTEVYHKSERVGTWETTRFTGAIAAARKEQLLARTDALLDAVKQALERANQMPVEQVKIGDRLFTWLLEP